MQMYLPLVSTVPSQTVWSPVVVITDNRVMDADKVKLNVGFIKLFSIRY